MDIIGLEKQFNEHLKDHRKQDRERADVEVKILTELSSVRKDIKILTETMPITLKDSFVTKESISENVCKSKFNKFMEEYKEKELAKKNNLIRYAKGVVWVLSIFLSAVIIVSTGILDPFIR